MEKSKILKKIREFIKQRNFDTSRDFHSFLEDFKLFVQFQKKTKNNLEILTLISSNEALIFECYEESKNSIERSKRSHEIQKNLEKLFVENEDKHVGTNELTSFYNNYGIVYERSKERMNHSGRISKFRKKLNNDGNLTYWLISGKTMKRNLKIDYDVVIEGKDEKVIDGWCYTKNRKWLEEFFEHEIEKYKDITAAYSTLKKKWKNDSN